MENKPKVDMREKRKEENRKKAKQQIVKPKGGEAIFKKPVVQAEELSEIQIKLVNVEGEELGSLTTVSPKVNRAFLNVLLQKQTQAEEMNSHSFFLGASEVKTTLEDALPEDFTAEKTISVTCYPESTFNVKPLTRASSTLEGHADSILCCQFSPCGSYLASGGGDQTIRLWDIDTNTPLHSNDDHTNWVLVVSFSPDSRRLATGSVDGYLMVFDAESGKPTTRKIKAHSKYLTSISWKPIHRDSTSSHLLTSSKDKFVKIWDVVREKPVKSICAHEAGVTKSIWGGEGYLYTCGQDKMVKVWKEDGTIHAVLKGHAHWVNSMTLNTEFLLRTGSFDEKSFQTDNETMSKKAQERINKFKKTISANRFEKLVTGSDDFTLILWDPINSEKPIKRMTGHQQIVNHVAFSPDTLYLASASFDKSVKLWHGHTGEYIFTFRGHVAPVYQLAWSGDSRLLMTVSKDTTVKCWSPKKQKLLFDLPGHADEVYCCDWSPKGNKAVSGSKDMRLRIWEN